MDEFLDFQEDSLDTMKNEAVKRWAVTYPVHAVNNVQSFSSDYKKMNPV